MPWNFGTAWLEKTSFQSHIVEQHESYWIVLELWESVQGNLIAPLSHKIFLPVRRLQVACTEVLAAEVNNVFRLYDLNKQKLEQFLCLLIFI